MRILVFSLILLAIAKNGATEQVKSYKDYQVLRVDIKTKDDLNFFKSITLKNEYDFWKRPKLGTNAQIMATKAEIAKLRSLLASQNIVSHVVVSNVEDLVAEERNATRRGAHRDLTWDAYYTWETIEPWILALEGNENAAVTVVGKSWMGRPIYMVKVSTGPSTTGLPKKAIFIDANMHAREWIAVAAATWVINELIKKPADYAELLDSVDIYLIPMANPDGYVFTESQRFWHKTRSIHPDSSCRGADINRNFGFMWGGENTSPDPCSNTFMGTRPFSEPEVRAIRDAIITIKHGGQDVQAYISLHSCGNVWLLSWGWTVGVYPEDYPELEAWGERVVQSILAVDGTLFEAGQGADIFYGVGGASDDFAKSVGIKYAATCELRCGPGDGLDRFILPPEQIIPTSMEVLAAILETGRTIVADTAL